ncbi:MAG: molybdopterin-dependent oxidoreductase, partial [Proteobacteria bacterium]|nr:molybdopterin-dependent oxidoreductase [Pseudomonadota bacterium]
MKERRRFIKIALGCLGGAGLVMSPLFSFLRLVFAEAKKIILPKGTARETLIDKNPALLDTRHLEPTPLKGFGTMGLSDHQVKLEEWRLEIDGEVKRPLRLSPDELKALTPIQRNVLLICPGFFANHGVWKGVSIRTLLNMAEADAGVTHVTLRGPAGTYEKVERFTIEEVLSDRV